MSAPYREAAGRPREPAPPVWPKIAGILKRLAVVLAVPLGFAASASTLLFLPVAFSVTILVAHAVVTLILCADRSIPGLKPDIFPDLTPAEFALLVGWAPIAIASYVIHRILSWIVDG